MKYSIVFLTAILIATASLAYADYYDEYRVEYCSPSMLATAAIKPGDCGECRCNKDGSSINCTACPLSQCLPGTQIGFKEEKDKPYPLCCSQPICRDDRQ